MNFPLEFKQPNANIIVLLENYYFLQHFSAVFENEKSEIY